MCDDDGLWLPLCDAVELLNKVMRESPGDTLGRIERGELRSIGRPDGIWVRMDDLLEVVRVASDDALLKRFSAGLAREVAEHDARRVALVADPQRRGA